MSLFKTFTNIALFFRVSLIFGIITCAAGIVGVASGSQAAQWLKRTNPRGDPLVCAFGLLTCCPFLFFALITSETNSAITWVGESFKVLFSVQL